MIVIRVALYLIETKYLPHGDILHKLYVYNYVTQPDIDKTSLITAKYTHPYYGINFLRYSNSIESSTSMVKFVLKYCVHKKSR